MKKVYLSPSVRYKDIDVEASFMLSTITIGGSTGEDLNDPVDEDPWS